MKVSESSFISDLKPLEKIEISIVIPTYNEKENLANLIKKIQYSLETTSFEIIIVDDNSPDGTGKIADEISNLNGFIKVIHRPSKLGLTSAIIDGFKTSKGEFIGVLDADLQHSPEILLEFLKKIHEGADLIIASRYIKGSNYDGWGLYRKIVSRVATFMTHVILPQTKNVMDPLSGYFILRKKQLCNIQLTGIGWKILLEIIVNCRFKKIVEVPYVFKTRTSGDSKLGFQSYLDFLNLLYILRKNDQ